MVIFSFFGQKSRVNNLAMVELITWPFFSQNFAPKNGQVINSTFLHTFLLNFFFFKNLILPAERRIFLKNN